MENSIYVTVFIHHLDMLNIISRVTAESNQLFISLIAQLLGYVNCTTSMLHCNSGVLNNSLSFNISCCVPNIWSVNIYSHSINAKRYVLPLSQIMLPKQISELFMHMF